jgi:hypothetical protein
MAQDTQSLIQSLKAFAMDAMASDWLQKDALDALSAIEERSPGRLFDPNAHRPLTAAFFGGTGVGKSALLNRLAGQEVARTGVERPTSREVSIYLHESIAFQQLPNELPLSSVRLARHGQNAHRQVLWIDMPDIDSVDDSNRSLVLDWLPHIDVVIYVVSPERYRDDKGWQLLKSQGNQHAWLFILNQWDRGESVQFEDFHRLLVSAGFNDPIVLRTIAKPGKEDSEGGIEAMQQLLNAMASEHLMAQLDAHVGLAQLEATRELILSWRDLVQGKGLFLDLEDQWRAIWAEAVTDLMEGLEWTFIALVRMLAGRLTLPSNGSKADVTSSPPSSEALPVLWDTWAMGRVDDAISQLLVICGDQNLPSRALKSRITPLLEPMGRHIIQRGQIRLRHALALPGNAFQRQAMRLAGFLSILLPALALGWASYQVVMGYYESATHHLDYLGTDFAIHTLLLIALAWLGPWFFYTRLRPSVEASALKGLRMGVREALEAEGETIAAEIRLMAEAQKTLSNTLTERLAEVEVAERAANQSYAPEVRRMIART